MLTATLANEISGLCSRLGSGGIQRNPSSVLMEGTRSKEAGVRDSQECSRIRTYGEETHRLSVIITVIIIIFPGLQSVIMALPGIDFGITG